MTAIAASSGVWQRIGQHLTPRLLIVGFGAALVVGSIVTNLRWGSTLVVAAALATLWAVRWVWRISRGLVVSLLSTLTAWLLVWACGLVADPVDMLTGGFTYYSAYLLAIPAITALVWASRRRAESRGATAVLAHLALLATVPIRLVFSSAAAAPIAGALLAAVVVWWRIRLDAPTPLPVTRSRRLAVRVGHIGAAVMSALLLLSAVLLGGSGTARAWWPMSSISDGVSGTVHESICGATEPDISPSPVGTGPESWFSNKNLANIAGADGRVPDDAKDAVLSSTDKNLSKYTLYEVAGLRGLTWVNWQYTPGSTNAQPENCSLSAWIWTISGNAVMTVNLYLLQATIAMKELAQSKNPVSWLYDRTDSVVANMFVHFAIPCMSLAMIASAIMIGVGAARRGNSRETIGKFGASLGVMVLGGFIFGGLALTDSGPSPEHPDGNGFFVVASTLDETLGGLNSGLASAILSSLHTEGENSYCNLDASGDPNLGQRVSSCVLAETLAYQPWAVGQFGPTAVHPIPVSASSTDPKPANSSVAVSNPQMATTAAAANQGALPCYVTFGDCKDLRTYLIAQQGGPSITQRVNMCLAVAGDYSRLYADTCLPYFGAARELSNKITAADKDKDNAQNTADSATMMFAAFSGSNGLSRLTQAFSALFGTVVIAITLLTLAVITLVWHMVLYALFVMGPLSFTVGSFMGKTHLARTWVVDVLHTFIARFAYSFAMTLIIYVVCLVFRSPSIYGGLKILLISLILYGFWKLIHKIDDYIRPAEGSLNTNFASATQQGINRAGERWRNNGVRRQLRRQSQGRFPATRTVLRGGRKTVEGGYKATVGTVRGGIAAGRAGAGALSGAAIGAANAVGGKHKENVEAARELGHGKGRVMTRRIVGGVAVGSVGALRGGYQGARGRGPTYRPGSVKAVDRAVAVTKEARFQAEYQSLRAQEGLKEEVRKRMPVSPAEQLARRRAARPPAKTGGKPADEGN